MFQGWHRQCQITPYTSDTDFATWSKYLNGREVSQPWKSEASKHNLSLYLRFGEPTHTQEFSFDSFEPNEKVDLFFIYRNGTHFLLPFHSPPYYSYSYYPQFELCSGELLGYKLLVPCEPELIVETGMFWGEVVRKNVYYKIYQIIIIYLLEYGKNWTAPVTDYDYDYVTSPFNVLPLIEYEFNGTQSENL